MLLLFLTSGLGGTKPDSVEMHFCVCPCSRACRRIIDHELHLSPSDICRARHRVAAVLKISGCLMTQPTQCDNEIIPRGSCETRPAAVEIYTSLKHMVSSCLWNSDHAALSRLNLWKLDRFCVSCVNHII